MANRRIIKISETLMLRRVDPVDLLKRYLAGEFSKAKIPQKKVKVKSTVKIGKSLTFSPEEEVYRLDDRTITGKVILTTNHKNFAKKKLQLTGINSSSYSKSLSLSDEKHQRCLYCKRFIKGESVGIPLVMERLKNKQLKFHTEGDYCNFGCALASLKRQIGVSKIYRDPLYQNAECLLKTMFYYMHPDKKGYPLKEAPDWRLSQENGGPLTDEEFDSQCYEYSKVPSLVILPTKRQFIKLKIK